MSRIDGGSRPVNGPSALKSLKQTLVDPSPDTCPLPVPETLPTRHPAAAELPREIFPRNPCAQNEHNAGQSNTVRRPRATSSRLATRFGKQRFDLCPQFIINESSGHGPHQAKGVPCSRQAQREGRLVALLLGKADDLSTSEGQTYSATICAPSLTLWQWFTHKNGFKSRRSDSDPLAL